MDRDQQIGADWKRDLKIKVAWALLAKAVALTLLWALFFRGHQP